MAEVEGSKDLISECIMEWRRYSPIQDGCK